MTRIEPRLAPVTEIDDDEDAAELPAAAPDPLAAAPLDDQEVRALELRPNNIDEPREGALEVLRKGTEAKMPIDPDAGDAEVGAYDAVLAIRAGKGEEQAAPAKNKRARPAKSARRGKR